MSNQPDEKRDQGITGDQRAETSGPDQGQQQTQRDADNVPTSGPESTESSTPDPA